MTISRSQRESASSSRKAVPPLSEQEETRSAGVSSFRENLFFVGYNHVKLHECVSGLIELTSYSGHEQAGLRSRSAI